MKPQPILIKSVRAIDPSVGLDQIGDILLEKGMITAVTAGSIHANSDFRILDGNGLIACPGFIDLHAHLRDPGFEEKETIATGTRAAAHGGFTTVCCMPNTNPPMDNGSIIKLIKHKARTEGIVRVLPVGCVTKGREGHQLTEIADLVASGAIALSDDGNPISNSMIMRQALIYARHLNIPIISHCEDLDLSMDGVMNEGPIATRLGLQGIPSAAEESMAARDIALAELTGGHVHIAHVSTSGTVDLLRIAKGKGLRVTAEVTPHHLTLDDTWVLGTHGRSTSSSPLTSKAYDTSAKVYPPLRSSFDIQSLTQGLKEGVLDAIATDHAPHEFASKAVPFQSASRGISGLETAFGQLMSLVHSGKIDLPTLIARLTIGPARILGKEYTDLGTLKTGTTADLALVDPNIEWEVQPQYFLSKGTNTPIAGSYLKGMVMATIVGGHMVYQAESPS